MNTNKSKADLKAERKIKVETMTRLASSGRNMAPNERDRFDLLKLEVEDIDNHLDSLKRERYDLGGGRGNSGRTERDESFTGFLRGQNSGAEFRSSLDANAMSTAPNSSGLSAGSTGYDAGYLIPQGFFNQLSIALKAYGGISAAFKQYITPTGSPAPWPTVDPTAIKGAYITEMNQLGFGGDSAGTDLQFGQGMLNAWCIVSGVILASVQLVQDSAFDVDSFVADRIGEAIGRKMASEAVSGTGSSAMLGLITALNARGATTAATGGYLQLTTGQDVAVLGNYSSPSQTELVGNLLAPATLIKMVAQVDPAYYPNARWYFNATQAWNLWNVTDANGRPIINFQNGFNVGDMTDPGKNWSSNTPVAQLLGFPVCIDNNLPSLAASTTGGPVFGDLSKAMVLRLVRGDARVDVNTPEISTMVLNERYADYLQRGYIGYVRVDSRSNDLRAAVTVRASTT